MPRERQRVLGFALALEGAPPGANAPDQALAPMLRLAEALGSEVGPVPTDEFRRALRQRLLAVAAVSATSWDTGLEVGAASGRSPAHAQQADWRRRLVAAGTALAITTGGGAATAMASTSALPGDALYGVKRTVEGIRVALAPSELAKGERHLAIARTRLDEVARLLGQSGPKPADPLVIQELRKTFSSMQSATQLGSEPFLAAFQGAANQGQADPALLAPLDGFLREQAQDLATLTPLLPPELWDSSQTLIGSLQRIAAELAAVTTHAPAGSAPGGTGSSSSTATKDAVSGRGQGDLPLGPAGTGDDVGSTLPGAVSDAAADAASGAASAVSGQGLAGLDVDPSEAGGPGVSLNPIPAPADLPVRQPLPQDTLQETLAELGSAIK